ncbi:probable dual specificity protein phosphatase DDB_G0283417 [Battus philenor]|uniref:probable dual specificity protein phosphatase DDB_G0283417 n=1 Tax=Battus philenor TaxID=42288 RepID=UPI0035D138C9
MSFLEELVKNKMKLKRTETVVTCANGKRYVEGKNKSVTLLPSDYGFVVDTKPDNVPVMIVDHLYIGSQDCAENKILKDYNITNVLSLGIQVIVEANYKYVQCLDLPETDIELVLVECLPFIQSAVDKKENVLVHCNAGVSRTSMVAIAYLISKGMNYEDAYSLLKSKRPSIQPNIGFIRQLKLLNFARMA